MVHDKEDNMRSGSLSCPLQSFSENKKAEAVIDGFEYAISAGE